MPGLKDGLALISHGAALALHALDAWLDRQFVVTALSLEGYAANLAIQDPHLAAARPAPGQAAAADRLRELLASKATPDAARNLKDALCFRLAAPVLGAARAALDAAIQNVEIEINGTTTSPIVLVQDGHILSTPNFHAPTLTLALDAAAGALAHVAVSGALRVCKLLTARFSGLPAYLSPVGGGSASYVS